MKFLSLKKQLCRGAAVSVLALCSSAMADSSGHQHGTMPMPAIPMHSMPMDMDEALHHHPSHAQASDAINATGVIREVMIDSRQLKILHDPIDGWDMGRMQMKFQLDPSIDISDLNAGQKIRFLLRQQGIGKFLIIEITH
ncbi:MAG: copper-binding protein [Motiliproteus sp.]